MPWKGLVSLISDVRDPAPPGETAPLPWPLPPPDVAPTGLTKTIDTTLGASMPNGSNALTPECVAPPSAHPDHNAMGALGVLTARMTVANVVGHAVTGTALSLRKADQRRSKQSVKCSIDEITSAHNYCRHVRVL